jgi:hypothetical protein
VPCDTADFRARAQRALRSGATLAPAAIDALLTDGCAIALSLETQLRSLRRSQAAGEEELASELEALQATLAGLHAHRARAHRAA